MITNNWQSIGEIAERIMPTQQPIFKRLHQELKIPQGYFHATSFSKNGWVLERNRKVSVEPKAPPLSRNQCYAAANQLHAAGAIADTSTDALIDAVCARLGEKLGSKGWL